MPVGISPGPSCLPVCTISEETAAQAIPTKDATVLVYCRAATGARRPRRPWPSWDTPRCMSSAASRTGPMRWSREPRTEPIPIQPKRPHTTGVGRFIPSEEESIEIRAYTPADCQRTAALFLRYRPCRGLPGLQPGAAGRLGAGGPRLNGVGPVLPGPLCPGGGGGRPCWGLGTSPPQGT